MTPQEFAATFRYHTPRRGQAYLCATCKFQTDGLCLSEQRDRPTQVSTDNTCCLHETRYNRGGGAGLRPREFKLIYGYGKKDKDRSCPTCIYVGSGAAIRVRLHMCIHERLRDSIRVAAQSGCDLYCRRTRP